MKKSIFSRPSARRNLQHRARMSLREPNLLIGATSPITHFAVVPRSWTGLILLQIASPIAPWYGTAPAVLEPQVHLPAKIKKKRKRRSVCFPFIPRPHVAYLREPADPKAVNRILFLNALIRHHRGVHLTKRPMIRICVRTLVLLPCEHFSCFKTGSPRLRRIIWSAVWTLELSS